MFRGQTWFCWLSEVFWRSSILKCFLLAWDIILQIGCFHDSNNRNNLKHYYHNTSARFRHKRKKLQLGLLNPQGPQKFWIFGGFFSVASSFLPAMYSWLPSTAAVHFHCLFVRWLGFCRILNLCAVLFRFCKKASLVKAFVRYFKWTYGAENFKSWARFDRFVFRLMMITCTV